MKIDSTKTRNANKLIGLKVEKHGGYIISIEFKGEGVKDYKPDAFINVQGVADLNEMIKDNHLKMLINGEEYWIPFVKKTKIKGE